jgi:magnesium transporter
MGPPEWHRPPAPASSTTGLDLALAVPGSGDSGDGGSTLQRWSSLIGIVTAICGNVLISFALNIQRYAHIRLQREGARNARRGLAETRTVSEGTVYGAMIDKRNGAKVNGSPEADPEERASCIPADSEAHNVDEDFDENLSEREPLTQSFTSARSYNSSSTMREKSSLDLYNNYLRSPYWWAGIILMTIGEAGNFLAYGFAPASIVSPLGVVALISNCVIAPLMLKEPFRVRDFWGVVVAVTGAVVVVLSAKQSETKLGPHEIWGAIARWEFETYLGVTIALILLGVWLSGKYGDRTILIDLGLVALFGRPKGLS